MSNRKMKELKAWFSSPLELNSIGEEIKRCGLLSGYEYDYENVYEWLECPTDDHDVNFNISRKRCNFIDFESEPIHVKVMCKDLEPKDVFIEFVAKSISKILNTSVTIGKISYMNNDEFIYLAVSKVNS